MLVRAGHRCPTCFCLTSLCRCQRERVTFCLPSMRGNCIGHSHRVYALLSLPVSQAGDLLSTSGWHPLLSVTLGVSRATLDGPVQHELSTSLPMAGPASLLFATTTTTIPSKTRAFFWTSELVQHAVHLLCSWFVPCSFSASMNPYRPGADPGSTTGRVAQDGGRRRTGEARSKGSCRPWRCGSGCGCRCGTGCHSCRCCWRSSCGPDPKSPAPKGEPSASASSSTAAPTQETTHGPSTGAYPEAKAQASAAPARLSQPATTESQPSIAAGPKPSGGGPKIWAPTLKMKAPPPNPNLLQEGLLAEDEPRPPPPPKRPAAALEEAEHRLVPTAPTGEPSQQATPLTPPVPPASWRKAKRSRTQ